MIRLIVGFGIVLSGVSVVDTDPLLCFVALMVGIPTLAMGALAELRFRR